MRQISLGQYGAIVVREPGQTSEPRTEHLVIVGETMVGPGRSRLQVLSYSNVLFDVRVPRP